MISHTFVVVIIITRNVDVAKVAGEAFLAFAAVVIVETHSSILAGADFWGFDEFCFAEGA